ncbi:DSBA domain-containing protein [Favolaschia claudopus]|uniref:DSBA domain-containing protein n=1 Tax=Favolaschia claudopus TaxID=2862362 RepID=A0AAW0CUA2_9AGAR
MAAAIKPVSLQIISDSICPFCYLGYKQITLAIEAAKKQNLPLDFNMRFKPYLLDPTLPTDAPVNKRERLGQKFGMDRIDMMEKQMQARGRSVGINFSYGGLIRQTTDSHRIIAKAYDVGGEKSQRALVEALFAGYFEKEQDPGSHDFLASCAVGAGVFANQAEAKTWLAGTEGKDNVAKDIKEAYRMGVQGVPFILVNNKYAISGAQGEDTFLQIFQQIAAGKNLATASDEESIC